MRVNELIKYGIDENFVLLLKKKGIKKLYPHQEEALKKGLMKGKNLIIAVPTASGKTLIAMFAFFNAFKRKKKIVYLVPLVSLANEKFEEFSEFFPNKKVALSIGDYDSDDPFLAFYDIIVCTVEKFDSLMRHKAEWIRDVGLVVVDEIHLLNDPARGPNLEIVLTKILQSLKTQIIALSATIKNVEELAEWLNADYVISDFRPVKLIQGVAFDSRIKLENGKIIELPEIPIEEGICDFVLKKGKQILFFVSTRKKAESLAKKLSSIAKDFINSKANLSKISLQILNSIETPTSQCRLLADLIKNGVAFHHSGLLYSQRRIIENNFKNGNLKVLVATTSLAFGVNLPSYCVVIRNLKRYYPGLGLYYIPVLEYVQMCGRAGRPKYDKEGIAIAIAKDEREAEEVFDRFVFGELENLRSKLGSEPILRMHVLGLIASGFCKTRFQLKNFFQNTFFSYQYGDVDEILEKVDEILEKLESWGFIKVVENKILPTRVGKRVSELYIDPLSAKIIIDGIKKIDENISDLSLLHLISSTYEMKFLTRIRRSEEEKIISEMYSRRDEILVEIPKEWEIEFEYFLPTVKLALVLEDWINEASEDEINKKYGIAPGDLRSIVEIAEWISYSAKELSLLLRKKEAVKCFKKLMLRIRYGVKEELLPFVRLEGIGRKKARKLYNAGIKTLSKLRKIPFETLSFMIGPKTAQKVKQQLTKEEKQKSLLKWGG